MNILVCNVGSTSLKYQLFSMEKELVLAKGGAERVGQKAGIFYTTNINSGIKAESPAVFPTHLEAIQTMLKHLAKMEITCVAFKVVHAKGVTGTRYLDEKTLHAMEEFNTVAPAHNPPYLAAIRLFKKVMPTTPLIGAFETAFHANIPPEAALYSIPLQFNKEHKIRRYGFHGASHEYLSSFASEKLDRKECKIISCHLGGSGSICAVKDGVSMDTSMGLSLQCGIMHNNRCGDIDPYIIFYMAQDLKMSLEEIRRVLETQSGFLGMTNGLSGDLRDVESAALQGNKDAEIAIKSYAYSIKKYIGSYFAALGGIDAIVFGGGIGTKSAAVRAMALNNLEPMGIFVDKEKNENNEEEISAEGSPVRIYVTETNEEIIVARKAAELLNKG